MRRFTLFLLFYFITTGFVCAQVQGTRQIDGTVTNGETGEPLAGVSVLSSQTESGTSTDSQGRFKLSIPDNETEILFSFVGFLSKRVALENRLELSVVLMPDVLSLNSVVVVGYGTQQKKDLTGAVSVVDVKNVTQRTVATLDQALQGQVAGVDVTSNSGSPGRGVTVRIRGIGTLNNADPLYVVDGMMMGTIDFLNADDIESIQVLKDASASAIYGSRGANGVVIITTKKGEKGNPKISFSTYYGVQNPWRGTEVMDGPTWSYLRDEAMVAAGNTPGIADPESQPTYDYFNAITHKNAPIYNMNLSFSGGSDKSDYYLSVDKFSQDGIIDRTGFDRLTLRANASYKPASWIKVGENLTMVKADQRNQGENDEWTSMLVTAFMRDPTTPPTNADGSYTKGTYNDTWNPAATVQYTNQSSYYYRTSGNVYANVDIVKGLSFNTSYSFEYSFAEADTYDPVYYVFNVQKNDVSRLAKFNSNFVTTQWTNTLNYDRNWGDHHFTAMAGGELYDSKYRWNSTNVNDIPSDDPSVRFIDNAIGRNAATVGGSMTELKLVSGLARVNYGYKDKYLFTGNFRADGSSKFLTNKNKWGFFKSFSAGWVVSQESFLQSSKLVSNLKLRVGWGQIGNEGSVPPYQYVTSAAPVSGYIWGGNWITGFAFPGSGNSDLKWETSTTTNGGIDFGLLENKISGSVDYFVKKTTGMLLRVPVPGQTGIEQAPFQNAGSMQNKGVEVSLMYRDRIGALSYSVGGNFSKINNKVLDLGANNGFIDGASFNDAYFVTRTTVGKPMAQFYGYKTDGLFQNWDQINKQTAQDNVAPGDVRYVLDDDGKIGFYYLGSPLPKFTYSFNVNLGYKGFDLSATLQGVYGNMIFNGPTIYTRSSSANWNLTQDMILRWHGEGTQNNSRYPRMNQNDVNNSWYSDRLLEDGSYLRFKTLQLGYSLSPDLAGRMRMKGLRFYVNAQNLFTFTKYTGMDPEIGLNNGDPLDVGVDRGFYPAPRIFSAGFNVTF